MIEDELQNNVEKGINDGSIDTTAYRKVFAALEKEPEVTLSPMFADNIISMLQQSNRIRLSGWELTLLIAGALFSIIMLIIAVVLTGFRLEFGFLTSMSNYKGLFIFGLILLLAFQWFDRRIIQRRLVH